MLKTGIKLNTAFDEYTCMMQIGQCGNGTVFKVQSSSGDVFALKAVDRSTTTPTKLKRFKNELYFCHDFSHKNIIKVLNWGAEKQGGKELIYYIMPYYSNTLKNKMKSGLDTSEVLAIFGDILSAVAFAHSKSVWHRDIKPENILIDDRSGKAVLADFGIAHFADNQKITVIETRQSERLANFKYAAPEQRSENGIVDAKSDIYALGLLLNEMFTREIISGSNYLRIGKINKAFAFLDSIVDQMVCQQPSERIYPADKIAKQILAAQTKEQESQKLIEMLSEHSKSDGEFHEIPIPTVIGVDYKNEQLYIYLDNLDYYHSQEWFSVLQQGEYSHGSMMGFETYQLQLIGSNTIMLNIPERNARIVKQMTEYIRDWLTPATKIFNSQKCAEYKQKMMEANRKQQAEIERLRAEAKAREELHSMLF
jgi:serine/threonine protein kinase